MPSLLWVVESVAVAFVMDPPAILVTKERDDIGDARQRQNFAPVNGDRRFDAAVTLIHEQMIAGSHYWYGINTRLSQIVEHFNRTSNVNLVAEFFCEFRCKFLFIGCIFKKRHHRLCAAQRPESESKGQLDGVYRDREGSTNEQQFHFFEGV